MSEKVIIDVTNDDIVRAIQDRKLGKATAATCPVAHAIRRQSVYGSQVSAGGSDAVVTRNNHTVRISYPPQVKGFIKAFDMEQNVGPIRFEGIAVVTSTPTVTPPASTIVTSA